MIIIEVLSPVHQPYELLFPNDAENRHNHLLTLIQCNVNYRDFMKKT